MTTPAAPTVPIGPTTLVGYGGTVVGLIASILVLIFPDGDEQTISLIATSVFTLGSFLVTQIGRYIQAREMAKPPAVVVAAPSLPAVSGSGYGRRMIRGGGTGAPSAPAADPDRPNDPAVDLVGEEDLPSDEEEAAAPPPDDDSTKTKPLDPDAT